MDNLTHYEPRIFGLILAGGIGSRLWPLSRREFPKQFLRLFGDHTLLQNTLIRLNDVISKDNIKIIAAKEWEALITFQAGEIGFDSGSLFINEPAQRNTGPAIAIGLAQLLFNGADKKDLILVCPSDHLITNTMAFTAAFKKGLEATHHGKIVTFGIPAISPETGYGYIELGNQLTTDSYTVAQFIEKPDFTTASSYIKNRKYCWNSGILCFQLGDMLEALKKFFPACGIVAEEGIDTLRKVFCSLPSISIDYAVMEKADNVVCVKLDAGWSDVGSWETIYKCMSKDANGNATAGDVLFHNSHNNLVISNSHITSVLDIDNAIIIDTPDALLVTRDGSSQNVREIVKELESTNRKEAYQASSNARPWGTYSIIYEGINNKVKRIAVLPHRRLSLQYHHHRSEHWIVIAGEATVTLCENGVNSTNILKTGESCFVKQGMLHRLANTTDILLEIIEVQTGEYVGEDDIVRVDDDYNRSCSTEAQNI